VDLAALECLAFLFSLYSPLLLTFFFSALEDPTPGWAEQTLLGRRLFWGGVFFVFGLARRSGRFKGVFMRLDCRKVAFRASEVMIDELNLTTDFFAPKYDRRPLVGRMVY